MNKQQAQEALKRCERAKSPGRPLDQFDFSLHVDNDLPAALEMLERAMEAIKELVEDDPDRVQLISPQALLREWEG